MFQAATPSLRGCRWLCLPLRQPAAEERWTERCMRCRGSWPRRVCHWGQTNPIGTSLRCFAPTVSPAPESSSHRMTQLVFGAFFECGIFPSDSEIVKIDVSALDLRYGMNCIDSPKGGTMSRGRIKNTSAVQHGLCCEPIDGPCGCLPFQRGTIECLANIGPLSYVDEPSGAKLKLLSPKTQHH